MIFDLILAFCLGSVGAAGYLFVFGRLLSTRLFSLESDVADLQERHLRTVRKQAAKERWAGEESTDEKILALAVEPESQAVSKKEWKKWGSLKNSSSEK